jgi:hypothetical protein
MPRSFRSPARKKAPAAPAPLSEPRVRCPMTGEDINIVKAGGMWIATTSLWTSRPFDFRDSLVYMLSHEGGVPPDMPRPGAQVLRDANEPPGPREPVGPIV